MGILDKQVVSAETADQLTAAPASQRRREGRTATELLGKLGIVIKLIASKAFSFLKPLDTATGEPTGDQLFMHMQAADDPSTDIAERFRVTRGRFWRYNVDG